MWYNCIMQEVWLPSTRKMRGSMKRLVDQVGGRAFWCGVSDSCLLERTFDVSEAESGMYRRLSLGVVATHYPVDRAVWELTVRSNEECTGTFVQLPVDMRQRIMAAYGDDRGSMAAINTDNTVLETAYEEGLTYEFDTMQRVRVSTWQHLRCDDDLLVEPVSYPVDGYGFVDHGLGGDSDPHYDNAVLGMLDRPEFGAFMAASEARKREQHVVAAAAILRTGTLNRRHLAQLAL